ncbi:helix-turn-helix domain-containing protein [Litoreibacter roseus]|uniref:HTH cro/C1-type domain-containing protein n=1 Tax=Litoreibacter roseus TaxID=2601869 RepID=A0A6N6JHZ1_9RHOB|nr:helix-turn-helix domain-containing protein [Litoreibacter roseus]GFE65734.1 hypothetical protein KIN_28080 [Litoreibacter roseus]
MNNAVATNDYEAFGDLVRRRRHALGMSQESLAAEALGNADRKSFVSAIENNRLAKVTPATAKKLSGPLGLTRSDLPAALRWPSASDPSPTEARLLALEAAKHAAPRAIEEQAIARFLNRQLAEVLQRSMSEIYRERLRAGLNVLQTWLGAPFSLQSLLACYALGLLYVILAGAISSFQGGIYLGEVNPFRTRGWAGAFGDLILPYLGFVLLILALGLCWYLVRGFGLKAMSERQVAMRLGGVAVTAGVACGVVDYLGTASISAAVLFTAPSCAALSTLSPSRAAAYGAACGIILGLMAAVSSGLADDTMIAFLTSMSEGIIVGGLVGLCAGLASALIARQMDDLRPRQLAAAGGSIAIGAMVALAGLVAAGDSAAVSEATLGLFSVSWLALPAANALLDFLSLGTSHAIGRHIVKLGVRPVAIFGFITLDFLLAAALMVFAVVIVGLALTGVTLGVGVETQSQDFLERSWGDPWGEGLWLTLMALTTVLWTWLHFAFVLAPLAAGALVRAIIERPALDRLARSRQDSGFNASVGVLVSLRYIVFCVSWGALALSPILLLAAYPETMRSIIGSGLRTIWLLT